MYASTSGSQCCVLFMSGLGCQVVLLLLCGMCVGLYGVLKNSACTMSLLSLSIWSNNFNWKVWVVSIECVQNFEPSARAKDCTGVMIVVE
jgi:hypothetical protein